MKNFIVEDRKAGEVVLEGKISEGGGIIVTSTAESLSEVQTQGIVSQISKEVAAGKTRGRVSPGDLDWLQVVS